MQNNPFKLIRNQQGVIPVLILIAIVGLIAVLGITSLGSFKGEFFSKLYPRAYTQAASSGVVFVNESNQIIETTTSPNVKLQLTAPWPPKNTTVFKLVPEIMAQTVSTNLTSQVNGSSDDVVEVGGQLDPAYGLNNPVIYLGGSTANYTGIRFNNLNIPKKAAINSAKLQVYSGADSWIKVSMQFAADNAGNSQTFSSTSIPSKRALTTARVKHNSNSKWSKNTWYTLNEISPIIQEIVNRPDWVPGNSISLIIKGSGAQFNRKFVTSFDGGSTNAPKLLISYAGSGINSPLPSSTPAVSPSPSATPVPTTTKAMVAEDANFTQNTVNIDPYPTTDPYYLNYTFSSSTAGTKTVYVKFTSSQGEVQNYSASIQLNDLISPSPSPISTTKTIWGAVDPLILGDCPATVHDKYLIDGGDGFYYRIWHPQADPGGCTFAHEHGDNPDTMTDTWVRQNWDPKFGYAARRMTSLAEPNGHAEAHEGYKVFLANVGAVNDEGRTNKTATISTFHMGTGTPKRFTLQHHSNSIAYRYETGSPYAATHLMMDTGSVSDVCDPRTAAPTKDGILLQNRCKLGSPYEIWSVFQTIKNGTREVYRGFATPAVFDPITVFNKDNPAEVVYAWDPRVANIKLFNDDWSGFRGCSRESYAQVGYFYNGGGPATYYTDPMGNVVPQSDPMAIRQTISASNVIGLLSTSDNVAFKKRTSYCQLINKLGLKN